MRFEFYHAGLDDIPKLSLDGTVSNSVHFSHWEGNETPAEVKADTSTEIALNLISSPNRDRLTRGIDLVTNNHFDTDGVLSVWTVLTGEPALELRDELISSAEAGDFSELTSDDGVRASLTIQGPDPAGNESDSGSPLAKHLNGGAVEDDARAYELILPEDLPESILESASAEVPVMEYQKAVNEMKKNLILKSLQQANGNYTEAAKLLGLAPTNLHRLIRTLNIKKSV